MFFYFTMLLYFDFERAVIDMASTHVALIKLLATARKEPDLFVYYEGNRRLVRGDEESGVVEIDLKHLDLSRREAIIHQVTNIGISLVEIRDFHYYGFYASHSAKFLEILVGVSETCVISKFELSELLKNLVLHKYITEGESATYKEKIRTQFTARCQDSIAYDTSSFEDYMKLLGYYLEHEKSNSVKIICLLNITLQLMPHDKKITDFLDMDAIFNHFHEISASLFVNDINPLIIATLIRNESIKKLDFGGLPYDFSPQSVVDYLAGTNSLEYLGCTVRECGHSLGSGANKFYEMKAICDGLTNNKSITEISFLSPILNDETLDLLLEALARNRHLPLRVLNINESSVSSRSTQKILEFLTTTKLYMDIKMQYTGVSKGDRKIIKAMIQSNKDSACQLPSVASCLPKTQIGIASSMPTFFTPEVFETERDSLKQSDEVNVINS